MTGLLSGCEAFLGVWVLMSNGTTGLPLWADGFDGVHGHIGCTLQTMRANDSLCSF